MIIWKSTTTNIIFYQKYIITNSAKFTKKTTDNFQCILFSTRMTRILTDLNW